MDGAAGRGDPGRHVEALPGRQGEGCGSPGRQGEGCGSPRPAAARAHRASPATAAKRSDMASSALR